MKNITSINDGIERNFIFDYECPHCNTNLRVEIPLYGLNLDTVWGITCKKCMLCSQISKNLNHVIRITRKLSNDTDEERYAHSNKIFIDAVAACSAILVKSDKTIEREDIRAYKDYCVSLYNDNLDYAKERLKFYINNLDIANRAILKISKFNNEQKNILLQVITGIYNSTRQPSISKQVIIDKMVNDFSLPSGNWEYIKKQHTNTSFSHLAKEYEVLGLNQGATFSEVKAAYLKKSKEFHPDSYQNLPESFQKFATENFREVQEAYEKLKALYDN